MRLGLWLLPVGEGLFCLAREFGLYPAASGHFRNGNCDLMWVLMAWTDIRLFSWFSGF